MDEIIDVEELMSECMLALQERELSNDDIENWEMQISLDGTARLSDVA